MLINMFSLFLECPRTIANLPSLNSYVSCVLMDFCTAVTCCMDMATVGYSMSVSLQIDPCLQMMSVAIERYNTSLPLLSVTFGEVEELWLFGVVRLR